MRQVFLSQKMVIKISLFDGQKGIEFAFDNSRRQDRKREEGGFNFNF
jgi:hypothetical protein